MQGTTWLHQNTPSVREAKLEFVLTGCCSVSSCLFTSVCSATPRMNCGEQSLSASRVTQPPEPAACMQSGGAASFQPEVLTQQLKSSVFVTDTNPCGRAPIRPSFIADTEDTCAAFCSHFPPPWVSCGSRGCYFFNTTPQKCQLGCAVAFRRGGSCSEGFEEEEPAAVGGEDRVGGEQPGGIRVTHAACRERSSE